MNTNVKDIINLLEELEVNSGYDVYLPSLNKEVKFKQLTTEQLKQLLKTAVNAPIYNTEFILIFNSIIKQNCLDKDVNVDALTVYDKLFVLFKTKIECISPDYTFIFTDEEVEAYSLSNDTDTVSVEQHYNNFVNKKYNIASETYTQNNCSVDCSIPTIEIENKLETELHKNNKINSVTEDNIQSIIGDAFISEVTKFINKLVINDKEINLGSLSFKDRITVVEKLPVTLINNVLKYIESYKNTTNELVIYTFKTDKGVIINKQFPLDTSFFNI
jgi:hypothetical protein